MFPDEIVETSDTEEKTNTTEYWNAAVESARRGYTRLEAQRIHNGEPIPKRRKLVHPSQPSRTPSSWVTAGPSILQQSSPFTPSESTQATLLHPILVPAESSIDGLSKTTMDSSPKSSPTSSQQAAIPSSYPFPVDTSSPLPPATSPSIPSTPAQYNTLSVSLKADGRADQPSPIPSHSQVMSHSQADLGAAESPAYQSMQLSSPNLDPLQLHPHASAPIYATTSRSSSPALQETSPRRPRVVSHTSSPSRHSVKLSPELRPSSPSPDTPPAYEVQSEPKRSSPEPMDSSGEDSFTEPQPLNGNDPVGSNALVDIPSERRYALRQRTKQQEHPYLYDQAMYQKQFKSNPEAIVKNTELARLRRNAQLDASQIESGDADFIATEESQEQTQMQAPDATSLGSERAEKILRKRRREPQVFGATRTPASQGPSMTALAHPTHKTSSWLANIWQDPFSSDEDAPPLLPPIPKPASTEPSRKPRLAPFPMRSAEKRPADDDGPLPESDSPPRPRLFRRHRSMSSRVLSDPDSEDQQELVHRGLSLQNTPAGASSDASGMQSDPPSKPAQTSSDVPDSDGTSGSDAEMSKAQQKALGRMVPKVLANLMLSRPVKKLSVARKEITNAAGPLAAGQSRKRIGTGLADRQILGDEESESDRSVSPATNKGVSEESDRSSNADVDDAAVQTWLEESDVEEMSTFDRSTGSTRLKQGSLVDFMLQSTTGCHTQKKRGLRNGATIQSARDGRSTRPGLSNPSHSAFSRSISPSDAPTWTNQDAGFHHKTPSRPLHVVTGGVQPMNLAQQRQLPYVAKAVANKDVHEGASPSPVERANKENEYWVHPTDSAGHGDYGAKKRKKHRSRVKYPGQTYTFFEGRSRPAKGTKQYETFVIELQDNAFHRSLAPRPSAAKARDDTTFEHAPRRQRPVPVKQRKMTSYFDPTKASHSDYGSGDIIDVDDESEPAPQRVQFSQAEKPLLYPAKVDCNVPELPFGRMFKPGQTYLGRSDLDRLLSVLRGSQPQRPAFHAFESNCFDADSSEADFIHTLHLATDYLNQSTAFLRLSSEYDDKLDVLMRAICEHVSWRISRPNTEVLRESIVECIGKLESESKPTSKSEGRMFDPANMGNAALLPISWLRLELFLRIRIGNQGAHDDAIERLISELMEKLLDQGFDGPIASLTDTQSTWIEDMSPSGRVAGLWICLIHVSIVQGDLSGTHSGQRFWDRVLVALESQATLSTLPAMRIEMLWKAIFSLCALSHTSSAGVIRSSCVLPAAWSLVSATFKNVDLNWGPSNDRQLGHDRKAAAELAKRDSYIHLIILRCFLLSGRWKWSFNDAGSRNVLNYLIGIFKSRKYSDLLQDKAEFPRFVRDNDMGLLSMRDKSDSAFTILLKLAVRAVEDYRQGKNVASNTRTLLSMIVPVSKIQYASTHSPTEGELSMLYNRLSAVAVSVYLDPQEVRLKPVRTYVDFKDADFKTRQACIRGVMHLTILFSKLKLGLDSPLEWATDMANILLDEFSHHAQAPGIVDHSHTAAPKQPKQHLLRSLQLLLGSIRLIMDSLRKQNIYPDPRFLKGPWLSRIFLLKDKSILTDYPDLCYEIRRLVQTFLDVRSALIPPSPRPALRAPRDEESQESQDDYGDFEADVWDLALNNVPEGQVERSRQEADGQVSNIVYDMLVEKMYMFVCKFLDPSQMTTLEDYDNADGWIDCWVGCAGVVVQHKRRDWTYFIEMGELSWNRISDTSWRRRVGLRFMYMMLRLDPSSYIGYTQAFIRMLMECLVTAHVTLEHKFAALHLSIDRGHNGLLRGVDSLLPKATADFDFTKAQFAELRLPLLERIATNVASHLSEDVRYLPEKATAYQSEVEVVHHMLSTMKQTCLLLNDGQPEGRARYITLCYDIYSKISLPALRDHPRLKALLEDIRTIS